MSKNYYFVEKPTDFDLIGYDSYVEAINDAIANDAKFIGLVSDFGIGKSSVISMLKNKYKSYKCIDVNLWDCDERKKNEKNINIHMVFLHQLIDKLFTKKKFDFFHKTNKIKSYFKHKLNKNYRLLDMVLNENGGAYIFAFFVFLFIGFFDKLNFFNAFLGIEYKTLYYVFLAILAVLCIYLYKPLVSFNKDNSNHSIDENDTKDLYMEIINKYRDNKKKKDETIIINVEELDRYDNVTVIIRHLKEFYKFYKISDENVVFIISIKSANLLVKSGDTKYDAKSVKNTYEKVFDFIINLNSVYVQNYDSTVIDLLNHYHIDFPDGVEMPKKNKMGAWRYLFLGDNITIRDIKHRYNIAVSLYLSAMESGVEDAKFNTCLYISYLEDEHNELYGKITNNSNVLMNLLLYFAKNRNLDNFEIKNFVLNDDEKAIVIDGIEKKYIDVDYYYYFFKFPKNKTPLTLPQLNLYNSVFFDQTDSDLYDSLEMLNDSQIYEILKMRIETMFLPIVVFKYKKLLRLAFSREYITLMNTLVKKYGCFNNFSSFEELVNRIKIIDKISYNRIFQQYFSFVKNSFLELDDDSKYQLRVKLVKLFNKDAEFFSYMFDENCPSISAEEVKIINDLNIIIKLSNDAAASSTDFLDAVKALASKSRFKTHIINALSYYSKNEIIDVANYFNLFYSINFNKIDLNSDDIKKIYNFSIYKSKFKNLEEFKKFINHLGVYNDFIDDKYLEFVDYNNKDDVLGYIKLISKHNFVSYKGLGYIDKCPTKFELSSYILDSLYSHCFYLTYVISKKLSERKYILEKDKLDNLKDDYIRHFIKKNDWFYECDSEMKKFLFDKVDFSILSTDQLSVFQDCDQNIKLIEAVLNCGDSDFINKYITMIKFINKTDRKDIYDKVFSYHKDNSLSSKARKNMRVIAKNKYEKDLFDGRKHH